MEHRKHALKKRWLAALCAVVLCVPLVAGIAYAAAEATHTYTADFSAGWQYDSDGTTVIGYDTTATVTLTCEDGDSTVTVSGASYTVTTVDPTCTENGSTTYTASVTYGGQEYSDTKSGATTEALGHDYVATVTDPTCIEQGYTPTSAAAATTPTWTTTWVLPATATRARCGRGPRPRMPTAR